MTRSACDVVILGAGIHGLCVARTLVNRGVRRITVFDRFAPGHTRGGSHGRTRITRSSYHDPLYVALAARARREDWPRLERDLGFTAITPVPGLFFGPDSPRLRAFAAATLGATQEVERLAAKEARRRFPMFSFADVAHVLLDHSAGVVHADRVMAGLRAWLARAGVDLRSGVRARGWSRRGGRLEIDTEAGPIPTERAVVAAGAFAAALVPALAARLVAVRQHVAWLRLDLPAAATSAPAFPVWARIGAGTDDFFYGLPDAGEGGVKVARHAVHGAGDDPEVEAVPDAEALRAVEAFAAATFAPAVLGRAHAETCLYAATPDEHFVLDHVPGESGVILVSPCSGHGFKFGPTIGEMAAALLLDGLPAPEAFALA